MTKLSTPAARVNAPNPVGVETSTPRCTRANSDHFVQFYHHDEFLVSAVGRFVLEGLVSEGSAIVIATPSHLEAIAGHLRGAGVALDGIVENGRYIPLDAAETLQKLMVNGELNAELFERHIGSLVSRLTAAGRRLNAFGEMVALLWAEGKTDAAIRLEELWNELGERHAFNLFCAYPMKGFATNEAGRPFLHVCKAHSRVLPAEDYLSDGQSASERLQAIAILQQKAAALEHEVKERKHAEESLRQREIELTNFIETAPIGMHWVDVNGMITWANAAELAALGYAASEYVGRHISEFHADRAAIDDILRRLKRGETLRNVEARMRCKDGSVRTMMIDSSALWDRGQFVHSQCFTRDVTEQRKAEEASLHLASIVETSDDAIFSKSLDGIITSWNKSAERMFGYTAEEAIGRPIMILIPPERLDEEPMILSRLRRGERVDHFETVRRRKDGTLLDISVTISPIKDGTGKVVGASKIARDITGKKRAAEALEAARADLARVNEELERRVDERTASLRDAVAQMEEFSYTVPHDLRAPLRGMQVYSEALLEDYSASLDAEARHCLSRIAENATRLDKMVLDVLTFSRISRSELRVEHVQLDKLVRDTIRHYPNMQAPHAQIEVATLHDVIGHEPSLIQIVSNLLSNAVKFVAPGTVPSVRVWTELMGNGVRLYVQDNGIGIRPERQDRLFKMFERIHPELPYEGTGVGLAIVRRAANRMGGEVGMKSDGASGATFWVQMPIAVKPA
jgi:PAS domain S-box-containing protein